MSIKSMSVNRLKRDDSRIIIHFDYDCFYAAVFEAENPALKSLPFAVQQKQIIVTCNYAARARGLRKLQLITEAKQVCPDVIIALGEDLTRFRDASKMLYKYLEAFTWNRKVERLGFDEVFMDCTDIINFNRQLLNRHDLPHSFFQLVRDDPTNGFEFDATVISGHMYNPTKVCSSHKQDDELRTRLLLGSHLAEHMRHKLEEDMGYTSTVGISTSKLLAKLVGNVHKPKGQTTLMPPYDTRAERAEVSSPRSNVTTFIDSHDIGKIPNIGFRMSHKLRSYVLTRTAEYDQGLIYGGTKETITVGDVRQCDDMSPELLEKLLGGTGSERGIGIRTWQLINGIDPTEVKEIRKMPTQISMEDSYIRLDTMTQIMKELRVLGTSLLTRMRTDLLEADESDDTGTELGTSKRWIAHPKTLRLSTRPRPPMNPDGTRTRTFQRISRSAPLPSFVFSLHDPVDVLVEKLIQEALLPMFRRLHPEPQGWNLSLMNIGVTNMVEAASNDRSSGGRDIGHMFRRQEEVLKDWKVEDRDVPPENLRIINHAPVPAAQQLLAVPSIVPPESDACHKPGVNNVVDGNNPLSEDTEVNSWIEDEEDSGLICHICGASIPEYAVVAHQRFHMNDSM